MRCLAVAQAWQDGSGHPVFVMRETTDRIETRLRSEHMEIVRIPSANEERDDAEQTIKTARKYQSDWVIVDGYRFGGEFQRALKTAGLRVLFVDDNGHAEEYPSDVVLNQNAHASENMYRRRERYTRLLLGTEYAMLRREFVAWRTHQRVIPDKAQRLLVTFGGSDMDNLTDLTIQAIRLVNVGPLEAIVVVGPNNPRHLVVRGSGPTSVQVEADVQDMSKLMAWADVAVSAAGSTCLETCLLGLPTIAVVVANNQRAAAKELERRGCLICLEPAHSIGAEQIANQLEKVLLDASMRSSLSQRGREIIDGLGARRVISMIQGHKHSPVEPHAVV